jgi:hypothetical protein
MTQADTVGARRSAQRRLDGAGEVRQAREDYAARGSNCRQRADRGIAADTRRGWWSGKRPRDTGKLLDAHRKTVFSHSRACGDPLPTVLLLTDNSLAQTRGDRAVEKFDAGGADTARERFLYCQAIDDAVAVGTQPHSSSDWHRTAERFCLVAKPQAATPRHNPDGAMRRVEPLPGSE